MTLAVSVPVSVVVPVKDEAENVAPLAREIAAALDSASRRMKSSLSMTARPTARRQR